MTTRLGFFAALSVLSCQLSSLGANLTFTGAISSDFYNPTNWSPNGTPSSGDTLNITNGVVSIVPAFTTSGLVNWSAGTIGGALNVGGSGTLALSGASAKYISGSITNAGTITLAGTGQLVFNAFNQQIVNQTGSLFDIQGDASISSAGYTGLEITNMGTFRKSAGTNTSALYGVPLQNSGTLSALSGTLDLQGGGTLGGNWTANSGASLTFSTGTFTLMPNAVSTGPGFIGVAAVSPSFAGTLGTAMGWTGGNIGGGWSISSTGTFAISGTATKYLTGSITNAGTITLAGTGPLQFNAFNQQIANQPGSLFDIQGDASINTGGYTGLEITNMGTFRKSAGTNTSEIGVPLQSFGTLSALSGTLDLQGGGTLGGNWTANSGAALTFSAGSFTLLANAVSSGAGFIGVAAVSPSFAGTLGTAMGWTGGNIGGGWSISSTGTFAISGTATKYLAASITNGGTITLAGTGPLLFNAFNQQIANQTGSLFDIQGDASINTGGFTGLEITNMGTFRKSAGTNTSEIGVPLQSFGTLSALSGTLDLQGGGTLGGNWTANSGAALTFSAGSFTLLANAVSSGAGFIGVAAVSPSFAGTLGTAMGWTGGNIGGGWSISSTGTFAISGTATKYLAASITNGGTITLAGTGPLLFNAFNQQIANQTGSLFDIQGDASINTGGFTGLEITNMGTFRKSAGTNTSEIGVPLQSFGTLSALSGTLDLQGGGTLGGNWTANSGAALTFSAGSFTLLANAVSSGAGFIGVAAVSPSFAGTLGTAMGWTGGNIGGGWSISSTGTFAISGTATKYLAASITNGGTITLAGTGPLLFNAFNQQIANQTGSLFDIQGNASINTGGFTGLEITNMGTFRKSAGTNTSEIGVPLQSFGTLSALSGTLDLQGGGTLGGNWTANSGAALTFSAGSFTLLANAVSSGAGFIGVAAVSPSFAGTLGTAMGWTGGNIGGGWSISSTGTFAISGTATKYLAASITNGGTITLAGTGPLLFNAFNQQIANQTGSLFDIQGDASINTGGFTGLEINNMGTFRKSAGTNTSSVIGIPFLNSGTLAALSGIISLTSPFTNGGGTFASRLNSPTDWGRFAFTSSLTLNGQLQVTNSGGFLAAQGSQIQLITSGNLAGTFGTVNVPTGTSVNYTNNAVYLLISTAFPVQLVNAINAAGNLQTSFQTASGQSYTIQRNDDLTTTNWVFYTNFTGNGSLMQFAAPTTNTTGRFFRVREP